MLFDKVTDASNRLPAFGEHGGEQVPDMDHFVPDFQSYIDAHRPGPFRHASGVIQQGFKLADLNQQRWQARIITMER